MDRSEVDRLQEGFARNVHERLPGAPIQRAVLLQYGDDPRIEPGQLVGRVTLEAPGDLAGREQVLRTFHDTYREAVRELRRDLDQRPEVGTLEFVASGADETERGPVLKLGRRPEALDRGTSLVPVMARLGPVELETVDTLVTAGIAANRAEAIRWALSRIRERPAYEELRERTQQIEELKGQF